jgi:hypothetical protein
MYVIGSSESGPVKLGISDNPDRRRAHLQTGHPARLRVFHQEPVSDGKGKARLLERLLHRDVSYLRTVNEWFNLTVEHAIAHVQFTLIHYGDIDNLAEKMRLRRI